MSSTKLFKLITLAAILALGCTGSLLAQITATPAAVALAATMNESISVSITTGGPVNFTLTGSTTDAGSVSPAWTTTWDLKPQRNTVTVCVYLSGALTGTGANTDTIPVANILAQANGGGSFLAMTGNGCGQAGNAFVVNTYTLATVGRKNISKNDNVSLEINNSALSLEPDTYSGTLNIVAQATP